MEISLKVTTHSGFKVTRVFRIRLTTPDFVVVL